MGGNTSSVPGPNRRNSGSARLSVLQIARPLWITIVSCTSPSPMAGTTIAAVAGLFPLTLVTGPGAVARNSIRVVLVGGGGHSRHEHNIPPVFCPRGIFGRQVFSRPCPSSLTGNATRTAIVAFIRNAADATPRPKDVLVRGWGAHSCEFMP